MFFLGIFIVELLILFFTSKTLIQLLSFLINRIVRSEKITVYVLALIFLPGVVIHELSHFLMASLLFVKTGNIEFIPEVSEGGVKLGSVQVAKTDPLRHFLIGSAPVIFGISLILVLSYGYIEFSYILPFWITSILFLYLLFVIGNTMFSSKKDMEGALGLFAALGTIVVLLFVFEIVPDLSFVFYFFNEDTDSFIQQASSYMLVPVGLNLAGIGLLKFLLR